MVPKYCKKVHYQSTGKAKAWLVNEVTVLKDGCSL